MSQSVSRKLLESVDDRPQDDHAENIPCFELSSASTAIGTILSYYRKSRFKPTPLGECLRLARGNGPAEVIELLGKLSPAWADHAIASVYSVLMDGERRKRLGAYFTPPHLVYHLVNRLKALGLNLAKDRIRDAAAGGAAFLVPIARMKVASWKAVGADSDEILEGLRDQLIGREIEEDLAILANVLLRRMLVDEIGLGHTDVARLKLVKCGNSLDPKSAKKARVDHEIGNPPFFRLRGDDDRLRRDIFSELRSGRVNLYAMFVRRAIEEVPAGGLIGYIIPASFLGGPEFKHFRRRILQLAEVLVIDLIEGRSGVFLGAIQDTCFLILRRRATENEYPRPARAASGILEHDGRFKEIGTAEINPDGEIWRLPGVLPQQAGTLRDWGYRATVGYLVANRQQERLHKRRAKGRFPMIWANAITNEGQLDFRRGASLKGRGWADAPEDAAYVIRKACVAVQRTSARGQRRRLNAAAVNNAFIQQYGGVIAENHVILLVPTRPDAVAPEILAEALNRPALSAEMDRVCGSASIPVGLLEGLRLGRAPQMNPEKRD